MSDDYDAAKNGRYGYDLGLRAAREAGIRLGTIPPDQSDTCQIWVWEGFRGFDRLDAVRHE